MSQAKRAEQKGMGHWEIKKNPENSGGLEEVLREEEQEGF